MCNGTDLPEQVVIVNGLDGETGAVVEEFSSRFADLTLVVHPNRNLATLRNLGLPFCTGTIVAMTDDDAVPDPNWIETIRRAHADHPDAGGIGGPVRGLSNEFASKVADVVVFPTPRPGQTIYTLPTVNMSYKRAALDAVGSFDETLFRGEDVDFNWRMVQAGYPIVFEPKMRVRHEHRTSIRGLYRQQWMYGRAYVLVRRTWPEMYSVYPHAFGSMRSWLKLGHAAVAILYQPWGVAASMGTSGDRLLAYPVLVGHHLVWKLGMVRQAMGGTSVSQEPLETPVLRTWSQGRLVSSSPDA